MDKEDGGSHDIIYYYDQVISLNDGKWDITIWNWTRKKVERTSAFKSYDNIFM